MPINFTDADFEFSENFFEKFDFKTQLPKLGELLLAEPFLEDTNFARTAILLAETNEEGALGFILNRPTKVSVGEILPELKHLKHEVYYGGPVGNDKLFYIHTLGEKLKNSELILDNIYWGGNFKELKKLSLQGEVNETNLKFFAGYSGWDKNQLEEEINSKSWITSQIEGKKIMEEVNENFWAESLRILGKKFQIMSNFPLDPSMN